MLARGLRHRGVISLVILLVALAACAAAAVGPMYYASAQTSILRDTFENAPLVERSLEVTQQGQAAGQLATLSATVTGQLDGSIPSAAIRKRVLGPQYQAIETSAYLADLNEDPVLAWRTDFCAHLQMASGRCATKTNEVIISPSLAARNSWKVGQTISAGGWPPLTITGIYQIPDLGLDYWFGRGGRYFPTEDAEVPKPGAEPSPDALFTPRVTIDSATSNPQGILVVDQLVNDAAVKAADLAPLVSSVKLLTYQLGLDPAGPVLVSQVPAVVDDVHASWRALSVPIFLISVQLLLLVWLLMFLVVRDAIDARGPEVALLRLRGRRGLRLLGFALGEPVALLVIALPLGVLLGEVICTALNHNLLRPGTPLNVPTLAWVAAGVATLGGLVASAVGAWRTLRRSVVDQWEHATREATRRSWVVDAIVVTAAIAGAVELIIGGHVTSVKQGSLGLIVPGLFGLALAVIAARLLPLFCRALFAPTRRRGGLGPFLAVRHVSRRSNGVRTTVILATAFALATFAVASWAIGRTNRSFVAEVGVGAPTVISTAVPQGVDIGAVVDRLDPSGQNAAVVDSFFDVTTGQVVLAVDPQRFANVAAWRSDFADESIDSLARQLAPAAANPITIDGDQIRVRVRVNKLSQSGMVMSATLASPNADGPVYNELGVLGSGDQTLTSALGGCPCQLDNLSISPPTEGLDGSEITGSLTLESIEVHGPNGWTPVPGVNTVSQWRVGTGSNAGTTGGLAATSAGLTWPVAFVDTTSSTLSVADRPDPLPAIINAEVSGASGLNQITINGLDNNQVRIKPLAVSATIPGTLAGGLIVDRTYAERAASGNLSAEVSQQVWTTNAAAPAITAGLQKAGIHITDTQTTAAQAQLYDRQGPGLASLAFATDAIAAAVLAAAGAISGLVSAARRRRFEYAALRAAGASRRTLFTGLLLEQLVLLLFGVLAGAIAGIAAAKVAVRSVPEFVTAPATRLTYPLPVATLAAALAIAVGALILIAIGLSGVLVSGVRVDQLREAQE